MDKNEFKKMNDNLKEKYPELYDGSKEKKFDFLKNKKTKKDDSIIKDSNNSEIRESILSRLNNKEKVKYGEKNNTNKVIEKLNSFRKKSPKNIEADNDNYIDSTNKKDNDNKLISEIDYYDVEKESINSLDNENNYSTYNKNRIENTIDIKNKSNIKNNSNQNKNSNVDWESRNLNTKGKIKKNKTEGNFITSKFGKISKSFNSFSLNKLNEKQKKLFKIGIGAFVILLLIMILPMFRVNSYEITGLENANRNKIEVMANDLLGDHVFFLNTKDLKNLNTVDPYINEVTIVKKYNGKIIINVNEIKRDFLLATQNGGIYLNRNGKVLQITNSLEGQTPILIDDTNPMNPGNTMYMDGDKKTFLKGFSDLMDQNISTFRFNEVNIVDINNIELKYKNWRVLIGNKENLKVKLNNAVNILKSVNENESGEVDLRFNAPPVIRKD